MPMVASRYMSVSKKRDGVPVEKWLSINQQDTDLDGMFRIYATDVEEMKTWKTPQFEKLPTTNVVSQALRDDQWDRRQRGAR